MGLVGRALSVVARAPVPIMGAQRFSDRTTDDGVLIPDASPLVDEVEAKTFTPGGPLEGNVVIKDQIDVEGWKTRVGLPDGPVAERDAAIVTRIRAAGGRVIGKAKMTELGIDGIGTLMHYAMPPNPRAPGYAPGGSSTGTAVAVATGLARWGVGGDGLGSIRIPAAFCGLVGLRPGRTRYPREGIRAPVKTLDSVGPITRTAADCATLWQVIAGEPVTALAPLVPARIGVPIVDTRLRVARVVWRAFRRMLDALGLPLEAVRLPGFDNVTFLGGMTGAYETANGPYAGATRTEAGKRGLALGRAFSAQDFARLDDQRKRLKDDTASLLARVPFLALPTTPMPPPALTHGLIAGNSPLPLLRALGAFTPLANLCDLPSIAAPMGIDERGRPLSIMFVGAPGSETELLRIAHAVEATQLGTAPL